MTDDPTFTSVNIITGHVPDTSSVLTSNPPQYRCSCGSSHSCDWDLWLDPTGQRDSTKAIQAVIDEAGDSFNGNDLPKGTFLIDHVDFGA